MIFICNAHVKPMSGPDLENGALLIGDDGKIAAVGSDLKAPAGAEIIDAGGRLVTPGCVDAHCHTGLDDEAMRWEGKDFNEKGDCVAPQMRAIDGFWPQDTAIPKAVAGGVTTVCTGPGSSNVVGGTFIVVKLSGSCVDEMVLKSPAAMKCAFGENPKNAFGQNQKKMPYTRMGVAALLRELLFRAKNYMEELDGGKEPKFDMKLHAMLPVMRGEIPLKCHAHRADDILTAVRIGKEFGVKVTLDHCSGGEQIVPQLQKAGYPVFIGPTATFKSKPEVSEKSFTTPGVLSRAGLEVSIITDAPVIAQEDLPLCAGRAVAYGMDEQDAWKAITLNPAHSLGVDDRIGSLAVGKDADVVIWTANPLTAVGGHAYMTLIDGKIVYRENG